jgi:hypothetical protein
VAESPLTRGEIWAGTDDGRVQITRDDGANWSDLTDGLTAAGAPDGYWVTRVVPSKHAPGTAYVTITGFHRDDFRPFVYRTDDWGASWGAITTGLDVASANVIAEDHRNPRLLFLGTDHGLFTSIDGGARWARMKSNMPVVPVRDVVVHPRENDLVVGTHGRGAFVTDITPLQQMTEQVLASATHLFEPEPKGLRVESGWGNYRLFGYRHITTPNEPNGVLLDVYRSNLSSGPLTLRITDALGNLVRELDTEPWAAAGIQRIIWDLRDDQREEVEPGDYTATLEADGVSQSVTVRVEPPVVLPRG